METEAVPTFLAIVTGAQTEKLPTVPADLTRSLPEGLVALDGWHVPLGTGVDTGIRTLGPVAVNGRTVEIDGVARPGVGVDPPTRHGDQ